MSKIRTSDLRIGNLIDYQSRLFQVKKIQEDSIFAANRYDKNDAGTILEEEIKGIQITKELLSKLGWYEEHEMFKLTPAKAPLSYIDGHLYIDFLDEDEVRVWMQMKEGQGAAVRLKYLHELQNLFHSLHFKEL